MKLVSPPFSEQANPDQDAPFLNQCYSFSSDDQSDGTMVWGSQVDMTRLKEFLSERNSTGNQLLTPTAILARAVGLALKKHPAANCRLMGTRIYQFVEQNVVLPIQTRNGPRLTLLRRTDERSYADLADELLQEVSSEITKQAPVSFGQKVALRMPHFLRGVGVRTLLWLANHFRLPMRPITEHLGGSPVIINHFGFRCAPPLIAYKPSRFGSRSLLLNVTLGPTYPQPVAVDDSVVVRPISGLFVRADHRTMDGRQLADFVGSIVRMLEDPARHELEAEAKAPCTQCQPAFH